MPRLLCRHAVNHLSLGPLRARPRKLMHHKHVERMLSRTYQRLHQFRAQELVSILTLAPGRAVTRQILCRFLDRPRSKKASTSQAFTVSTPLSLTAHPMARFPSVAAMLMLAVLLAESACGFNHDELKSVHKSINDAISGRTSQPQPPPEVSPVRACQPC